MFFISGKLGFPIDQPTLQHGKRCKHNIFLRTVLFTVSEIYILGMFIIELYEIIMYKLFTVNKIY